MWDAPQSRDLPVGVTGFGQGDNVIKERVGYKCPAAPQSLSSLPPKESLCDTSVSRRCNTPKYQGEARASERKDVIN